MKALMLFKIGRIGALVVVAVVVLAVVVQVQHISSCGAELSCGYLQEGLIFLAVPLVTFAAIACLCHVALAAAADLT